jgi:uncharacterized protein YggE
VRRTITKRKLWVVTGALALAGLLLVVGVAAGRGLGPSVALAADGETAGDPTSGSITVTGQATIKATPDTVTISLGVIAEAATAAEAMDDCSAAMTRIINSLAVAGLPRANIQTSNISLYPQYKYDENGSNGRIVGYQAGNQITCSWNKLDKIGDLIDAAVKAGANSVNGISFSLSDSRELYLEAIGAAARDAKAKADALAAAAGVRVGAVKSMSLDSYASGPIIMKEGLRDAGMAAPIEPGTVEMQVSVRIEYGIQ